MFGSEECCHPQVHWQQNMLTQGWPAFNLNYQRLKITFVENHRYGAKERNKTITTTKHLTDIKNAMQQLAQKFQQQTVNTEDFEEA